MDSLGILVWSLIWLASIIAFAVICSFIGRILEARHLAALKERGKALEKIETMNLETLFSKREVASSHLVMGSAVFSVDYLQKAIAFLLIILGGRIRAYERLLKRARDEAFVRLQEQAASRGADCVINVRFETSTVSLRTNPGCIEILSYGTALVFRSKGNRPYNFLRKGNQ